MNKFLKITLGMMLVLAAAMSPHTVKAQVYGEFDTVRVVLDRYIELNSKTDPQVVVIPRATFGLPPNFSDGDYDDGYASVNLGFDFEFNGEAYNKVWVNVNGFLTFGKKVGGVVQLPPFVKPKDPKALFLDANSYPVNVIAPFWGDHIYRDLTDQFANGFLPSEISYKLESDVVTIQWKNLNVNYMYNGKELKNSIANFQVKLYKSTDKYSKQGNIEFFYGATGGNPFLTSTDNPLILTKDCSVGIKGEGINIGTKADYMNAFVNDVFLNANPGYDAKEVSNVQTLSNEWAPTPIKEAKFLFKAMTRFNVDEWWGDGDVDFSKAIGNKHYQLPQNRFVTVNDARLIMKSVATDVPLDSIRRRSAFHGDVNHNGRYYRNTMGERINIPQKSVNYYEDLPNDISSTKQIMFEANEYDASLILNYMAARVPELPWLLDTVVKKGKISAENFNANGITMNNLTKIAENTFRFPVYINGNNEGAMSFKFNVNGEVTNVETTNSDLYAANGASKVVVAGTGTFSNEEPVCFVTVRTNGKELKLSNVRFNDKSASDVTYTLSSVENMKGASVLVQNQPNPFTSATSITVNVPSNGNYSLTVFDLMGNAVKSLHNGELSTGIHSFDWNGLNNAGEKVAKGMYIYRLTGNGVSESMKMVIE